MKTLPVAQMITQGATIDSVLRAAGAHDWTPEAAEAHKAAELAKAPKPNWLWPWHARIASIFNATFIVCLVGMEFFIKLTAAMFAVVLAIGGAEALAATTAWSWVFFLAVDILATFAAVTAGFTIVCGAIALLEMVQFRGPAEWKIADVSDFGINNMPPEARRMVSEVRQFNPHASILVHVLRQGTFTLDPVLQVEGRYVLVWDEQGRIVPPH